MKIKANKEALAFPVRAFSREKGKQGYKAHKITTSRTYRIEKFLAQFIVY